MTLEEMKQESAQQRVPVVEADLVTNESDQLLEDLIDGVNLLNSARKVMEYVADKDLCRAISRRERVAMLGVVVKIREYLDNVEMELEALNG
jgi:hypothetical protein